MRDPSPGSETSQGPEADPLAGVVADIDAEVDRQLAAGKVPPGFVAELDAGFRALAPGGGRDDRRRRALEVVARRAAVDEQVPVASNRPGGAALKRLVRKSVGWYVRFFAAQLAAFAAAVAAALRLLSDDLDRLQRRVGLLDTGTGLPLPAPSGGSGADGDTWWVAALADSLAGAAYPGAGRVLLLGAWHPAAASALRARGLQVDTVDGAGPDGDDVAGSPGWVELALDALGRGGPPAAVVLDGAVHWSATAARLRLVQEAVSQLAVGGLVAAVCPDPEGWAGRVGPVVADLAPGHPWSAATWRHVFDHHGLALVEGADGPPPTGGAGGGGGGVLVVGRRPA